MAYTAYEISPGSRAAILERFVPRFSDVICHHVTERFGVPRKHTRLPLPAEVVIVGYTCDLLQEALIVAVNGSTRRPDGLVYHITLSLERSAGRKPADSNQCIALLGWRPVAPMPVHTVPRIF